MLKNLIFHLFLLIQRRNYENKILFNLKKYKISFICLAGYMKIISSKILIIIKKRLLIFILHFCLSLKDWIPLREC